MLMIERALQLDSLWIMVRNRCLFARAHKLDLFWLLRLVYLVRGGGMLGLFDLLRQLYRVVSSDGKPSVFLKR